MTNNVVSIVSMVNSTFSTTYSSNVLPSKSFRITFVSVNSMRRHDNQSIGIPGFELGQKKRLGARARARYL
jgi:hypothetical protein